MKHIFVVNPSAGTVNHYNAIAESLHRYDGKIDYELYQSQSGKDAIAYVKRRCTEEPETDFRFYACGGDGTVNLVLQGVAGMKNASMSVYPCGSGNDFVKCMGGKKKFLDIDALINAKEQLIDVIRIGELYAVNVVNFGFDTIVCDTMIRVKRFFGKHSYTVGVLKAFITGMRSLCHVKVDGKDLNGKRMMLCTIANGQYVGGAFKCAPRSSFHDGELDVCLVNCLSRLSFVRLISSYRDGRHLDDNRFSKYINYVRGKEIEVESPMKKFAYCLDGEIIYTNHFTAKVIPKFLRFAIPQTSAERNDVSEDIALSEV